MHTWHAFCASVSQQAMDDEMTDLVDNFYKHRKDVFWLDIADKTHFGRFQYSKLLDRYDPNTSTPLDSVENSVTPRLINCSTRTVLYNLMFVSYVELLNEVKFVLILIQSNGKNENYALHSLQSIFNCIYFVLVECVDHQITHDQKRTMSDKIALHMETYSLCPCIRTHPGKTGQSTDYTFVLHDLPQHFYRDTREQGNTLPAPPPPPSTKTFLVRN